MCTMGKSRLSSLALMHIKYDLPVDLGETVTLFGSLHPRMFSLWIPIERVSLTVSEKFLTVLSLLWVSLRYHFIGRNIQNTHEKRTVRYKSQLICIYICHQLFFIRSHKQNNAFFISSLEMKGVLKYLCFGARSAFGFHFQNKHELRASG